MDIMDTLGKDVTQMTPTELASHLSQLKKLTIKKAMPKAAGAPKVAKSTSNKDKRLDDLIGKLSPEQLKKLQESL